MMKGLRTQVLILMFIIVSTILLIVLQHAIVPDLISNPFNQNKFTSNHGNNGQIHLQEIQEKAEHGMVERINEEQNESNKWRQQTMSKLEDGSTATLNRNTNASSEFTPIKEPKYSISFHKVSEPYYPNVFQYDAEGRVLYLKDNEMTTMRPGATKELVLSAPELFEKIPTRFLNNFKNPCWLRGGTELNCLPYFYIIGMYKCATTDIWDKLVQHPDVTKVAKEPHWWGPRRHGFMRSHVHTVGVLRSRNITGGPDDSSLEWYLNFYKFQMVPRLIEEKVDRREQVKQPYHPIVYGDASISTAYSMGLEWIEQYPNTKEPPYTNADLIRALQPNAKIVLMVRNPTKRAISWWWYSHKSLHKNLRRPYSAKTLHEDMINYIDCFNGCLELHNVRYCAYASGCPYNLIPDIQAGIYHVYLQDWSRAFSRDSVLVIRLEDWQANQVEVYRNLLDFLDLRQLTYTTVEEIVTRKTKNINKLEHEDAWPETVSLLDDFFRPYNQELAKLMGDDKFLYL